MRVCVCVAVPKTSGVMWWTSYDWLKRFYSFCMAAVSLSVEGVAMYRIKACRRNILCIAMWSLAIYSRIYYSGVG